MIQAQTPDAIDLMHKGAIALAQMEANGIRVDVPYLTETISKVKEDMRELVEDLKAYKEWKLWRRAFGQKSKLDSREQLAHVVFILLGHKCKELTPTGKFSTEESAFADIDLPFVRDYFRLQKLHKVYGTYLKGIQKELVGELLHPFFNLNTAVTFRGSSDKPNFQNMPIRNPEMGRIIRSCFIPRNGYVFAEIDFSGVEVRVAACYNHDPTLIKYVKDPTSDMHRDTACNLFLINKDQVAKKGTRDISKNMFVFPQFYGSYYLDCAKAIWDALGRRKCMLEGTDIPVLKHLAKKRIKTLGKCDPKQKPTPGTFEHHVKKVEDLFWNERFPVYTKWKKSWYEAYRNTGGFRMHTGFYVHGLFSRNDVINYPVQGAAFHCLLWCLIQLQNWLNKHRMKTKIMGQIHDSIILDIHESEIQDVLNYAKELMTDRILKAWKWIIVPLDTEADIATTNWHEKKPWTQNKGVWKEVNK